MPLPLGRRHRAPRKCKKIKEVRCVVEKMWLMENMGNRTLSKPGLKTKGIERLSGSYVSKSVTSKSAGNLKAKNEIASGVHLQNV